jgi:ketosteroid isomerase-like protein
MAEQDIRRVQEQFYNALQSMFKGDMALMNEMWSHSADITFMGPFGGRQVGWDNVRAELEHEMNMKMTGRVRPRDLVIREDGNMAYTICVEEGENMTIGGKPAQVSHRATSVYRKENGQWKLVHHHCDPALQQSAERR